MKRNPLFTAVFAPDNRSELNAEAQEWIGWEGLWEVTHLLDDEGPDSGTPMCTVARQLRESGAPHPSAEAFVWTPISDLRSIQWSKQTQAETRDELDAILKERYPSELRRRS